MRWIDYIMNQGAIDVWEWISDLIPRFPVYVITYTFWI